MKRGMIGRYQKVREIWPSGWGMPYILDRGDSKHPARLVPNTRDGDWWQDPNTGLWRPGLSGGSTGQGAAHSFGLGAAVIGFGSQNSFSPGDTSLTTAYTYGSAGAAVGARYVHHTTRSIAKLYIYATGYTGSPTAFNVEIRDEASNLPGSTLHASATGNWGAPTAGWVNATISHSLTAGTRYWIIVGDADGAASPNGSVRYFGTLGDVNNVQVIVPASSYSPAITSNGWIGATRQDGGSLIVTVFGDGTAAGAPFTAQANPASNTLQKGLYVSDGFAIDVDLWGIVGQAQNTTWNAANLYEGSDLPNDPTATTSVALYRQNTAATPVGFMFASKATIAAATAFRAVFGYGSNSTDPRILNIGTGANADLRSAMLGGGNWYLTQEAAGPVWSDTNTSFPLMALLLDDLISGGVGGGGGSAALSRVHLGM